MNYTTRDQALAFALAAMTDDGRSDTCIVIRAQELAAAMNAAIKHYLEAQPEPAKTRVEECRGYALLGTGQYCINHTANFHPELGAELIITLATDEDKSDNRKVGESRDNPEPRKPIQPEEMVIRIGFLSERGLFALEDQLARIRRLHFSEASAKGGA